MSLGPREATVKLTLGGVVADEFYARYVQAVIRAMNHAADWAEQLEVEFPKATGDLRRSLEVSTQLYGQEKSISFQITAPYAEYILEFGRRGGVRPPWNKIKEWALIKGVDLRKARAWWWKHSAARKRYYSPSGNPLFKWWEKTLVQFRYILERALRTQLIAAGFSAQDVQVTYT